MIDNDRLYVIDGDEKLYIPELSGADELIPPLNFDIIISERVLKLKLCLKLFTVVQY